MHWQKVTLVGVGLLGGSLGLALRQRQVAGRVEGFVRRASSVVECEQLGVVDRATQDLSGAVADADLVVLCTPIAQMKVLTSQMQPNLKRGSIVTDVGSVKGSVVKELEPLAAAAGAHFVGSHPMTGTEKMGAAAARGDLFDNAVCIITPTATSPPKVVRQLEQLWEAVGGRPLKMKPELHDELVSRCSHLPHVVAAGLVNYVLSPVYPKDQAMLCANGFRDTTRIASGSPEMWRDIVLANRKNLARALGVFIEDLREFQLSLEQEDWRMIEEFLTKAKERRDAWGTANTSPSPE